MRIAGLQPFTLSDYPGKPAAIIFTQGCNFKCPFCHNRELWSCDKQGIKSTKEVIDFLQQRTGILEGVVITGGEPTLQPDLYEFISKIKELNLAVKLDSNGSNPEILGRLIKDKLVDYIAMDIKAPWEKYHLLSGCTIDLDRIHQSVDLIAKESAAHHFRTTYYKKLLTKQDIASIKEQIPAASAFVLQEYKEVTDPRK